MSDLYIKLAQHPVINSERLILRPMTLDDTNALFELTSDLETAKYVSNIHRNLNDTADYIVTKFLNAPLGQFAIEEKLTGKMIGSVSYNRIDSLMKTAEIGYMLNRHYWNKGYMTETLKTMLEYGFEKFEFNSLMAVFDKNNVASRKVILKSGLKYLFEDPYSRKDFIDPQKNVTDVFYRLTKDEYSHPE